MEIRPAREGKPVYLCMGVPVPELLYALLVHAGTVMRETLSVTMRVDCIIAEFVCHANNACEIQSVERIWK